MKYGKQWSSDIGLYFGAFDQKIFNHIELNKTTRFGALMMKDHPLAEKSFLTPEDLFNQSLILYQNSLDDNSLPDWFHREKSELNITATFGMYLSAHKLVESGLGIALVLDDLVDYHSTNLVCLPLKPELTTSVSLIWKKYQVFSETTQVLLKIITDEIYSKHN
ncbi:LysR family transcriptional regulator substrate-binding protein [Enterococcus faecium]